MRPVISDSLISGQPLYLLYSNSKALLPDALFVAMRAEQATGSVRLQVTGRPPTISGPEAAAAGRLSADASAPRSNCRRSRPADGDSDSSGIMLGHGTVPTSLRLSMRGDRIVPTYLL